MSRSPAGQRPMRLLDLTLASPAENLALDEALLIAAEEGKGEEVLRLWELSTLAVIVGAGGSIAVDVNVSACETAGIPILRRSSGGGTVLIGPGCLCFSLVLAYDRAPGLDQIPLSNRYVLGRVLTALQSIAPTALLEGTSDLAIVDHHRTFDGGMAVKISGNAQQRKRQHFLHHGTLLCRFDLGLISKYLKAPERQPPYRHNRLHSDFVANLKPQSAELKSLLIEEWQPIGGYAPVPWDTMRQLVTEKYGREEWNRRR
jgi:lipoate---protein ligase